MNDIEIQLTQFLETINDKTPEEYEELIEEFGENCKDALRGCLLVDKSQEPFRIRMSNIGHKLRKLMLDKKYGRKPLSGPDKVKMTYGYLCESLLVFLLKASGVQVTEEQGEVDLDVKFSDEKTLNVKGSFDFVIGDKIWDAKSASKFSFENKFVDFNSLQAADDFGYIGQAIGYSLAHKKKFGGWIVINKADGAIKVIEIPDDKYRELCAKYLKEFKHKIKTIDEDGEMPPCDGVVKETFY